MCKIEVITFRGRLEVESIVDAQKKAKDMILDIITDGQPADKWWAQILWHRQHVCRTWSCPKVGLWQYTTWRPMYLGMLDFKD